MNMNMNMHMNMNIKRYNQEKIRLIYSQEEKDSMSIDNQSLTTLLDTLISIHLPLQSESVHLIARVGVNY